MESNTDQVELLFEKTKRYAVTSFELYKLKFIEKAADVISIVAARAAIVLVGVLFVLMINIGIVLWLGDLLGKSYYGFLVIAAFYGIAVLVLHVMRHKWIRTSVKNLIIEQSIN